MPSSSSFFVLEPAPARRGLVLVVSPDALLAAAVRRVLVPRHEIAVATGQDEALCRLSSGPRSCDVILCDLRLPDGPAMGLHETLSRERPEAADRIVFLTGRSFTQRARAFLQSVRNAWLETPLDAQLLDSLVSRRVG